MEARVGVLGEEEREDLLHASRSKLDCDGITLGDWCGERTCCSRAEPRSAQPYMKMFFFREWPCKSTNMPSGWAACVRRRSFLKALIVGWWRT